MPKTSLSTWEPAYQMQLQTAADFQSRSSKWNYQNQNNPIYIEEAKYSLVAWVFSMSFSYHLHGKTCWRFKKGFNS